MIWYSAVAALVLALTHLLAGKFKFSFMPRNMWLSFAGGLSVAYVFIHLLPELADGQEVLLEKGLEGSVILTLSDSLLIPQGSTP